MRMQMDFPSHVFSLCTFRRSRHTSLAYDYMARHGAVGLSLTTRALRLSGILVELLQIHADASLKVCQGKSARWENLVGAL